MRVDFPSLKAKQMTFRDAAHHMKQIFTQPFKTSLLRGHDWCGGHLRLVSRRFLMFVDIKRRFVGVIFSQFFAG